MRRNHRRSSAVRILGVVLAALLVAAGCGSDDDSGDDAAAPSSSGEIRTDGFEDLGDVTLEVLAEAGDEATLERATALFQEQYPNVTINVTLRGVRRLHADRPRHYWQRRSAPDVAHGNQGYTIDGLLVEGQLIIPLDEYSEVYGWEDAFGSGTLDDVSLYRRRQRFWSRASSGASQPWLNLSGVYYNKEKLAAIGGELPTTFEEFEGVAGRRRRLPARCRSSSATVRAGPHCTSTAWSRPPTVLRRKMRDWIFGEPGSTVMQTDEEQQAAEKMVEWVDSGYFPEGVNGIGWDDSVASFMNGEGVFLIGGNWNTATLEEGMGDNVGYFAMPVGPSGVLGGTAALALPWHISSKAEHPRSCRCVHRLDDETRTSPRRIGCGSGGFRLGRPPMLRLTALLADVTAGANEVIASDGVTLYADWATDTMFDTLTAKTQELLGGQITAEQFLADVQADWDAFFAE